MGREAHFKKNKGRLLAYPFIISIYEYYFFKNSLIYNDPLDII